MSYFSPIDHLPRKLSIERRRAENRQRGSKDRKPKRALNELLPDITQIYITLSLILEAKRKTLSMGITN